MTDAATLRSYLSRNRFMPTPPPELHFVGDGDYQAIGAEFLERLIVNAGLKPQDNILDIGCGVGRLALPLTQFLETGSYDGVDPVEAGISWCKDNISSVYKNMNFHHVNCKHDLYNPGGQIKTESVVLPFENGSIDLICMISVVTHLDAAAITRYASEASRLLAPGGRCFATAFLMNEPARASLASNAGLLEFKANENGPFYYAIPEAPLAAVAYDEDYLLELFFRHGLRRRAPGIYGNWSGRVGDSFQDICIFEKVVS